MHPDSVDQSDSVRAAATDTGPASRPAIEFKGISHPSLRAVVHDASAEALHASIRHLLEDDPERFEWQPVVIDLGRVGADAPIDWPGLVESQAAAFIDWTLSRQGFGDAVFHSDFAERRPLADNGILRLAAVIRAGQEAGAFGPVDPDPTARLLFAVIHEAADAVAGGADRAAILAALNSLLRRTLAP